MQSVATPLGTFRAPATATIATGKAAEGNNAFAIERQARALLVQHDWDVDHLHLEVVDHSLAEALMRDDYPGYRHWHEVYSSAVRLVATDDPLVMFRWLAEHPDLPIPDSQT